MQRIFSLLFLTIAAFATITSSSARTISSGTIIIDTPWARETPKGTNIGAGYLSILNIGDIPDRLISAQSDVSASVEIHTMQIAGGVMKMRKLKEGLKITPKSEVKLKPGGYHLMFIGLKAPLKKGQDFNVILRFERAGEVEVSFKTSGIGGKSPYMPAAPHSGSTSGSTSGTIPNTGSSKGSSKN